MMRFDATIRHMRERLLKRSSRSLKPTPHLTQTKVLPFLPFYEFVAISDFAFVATAVGVQGDARVYGYICILRAVTSLDMMSAEPYEFEWSLLKKISRRIVNEVDGIARVVYDTTSKPPGKSLSHASLLFACL